MAPYNPTLPVGSTLLGTLDIFWDSLVEFFPIQFLLHVGPDANQGVLFLRQFQCPAIDVIKNQSGNLYRTGQVQYRYKCYFFKYFFRIQDRCCTNVCIPVQHLYTHQKYQCCTGVIFGLKFGFFSRKIDVKTINTKFELIFRCGLLDSSGYLDI